MERDQQLLDYYAYPQQAISPQFQLIREKDDFTIRDVEFPSALDLPGIGPDSVHFIYYEHKESGEFPTILLLPIAGGLQYDPTTKTLAHFFAVHGFNCAIAHGRTIDENQLSSADYLETYLRQSVIDNRQILDFLYQQAKVDTDKIGCFGTSLGGIEATLVTAVDGRIKSTVIALGGGSIADIVCNSQDRMFRGPREQALQSRGITIDQLHGELQDKIKTDPLLLAPYIDARHVFMVIAAFDRTVPRAEGDQLWNAIGRPERVYILTQHYTSFIYLPYVMGKALTFFGVQLGIVQE
jgi:hypothetical protein